MKKTLLSFLTMSVCALGVNAQVFTPAASALPDGELNVEYIDQVLNFTVPATAEANSSVVGDPISIPGPFPLELPNPNIDLPAEVIDVTWTVEGLPNGLTATCDATPCTYVANASGTITISGTPTEGGTFTINVKSMTNGSVSLPAPISQTIAFPQAVPGLVDEDGYTLFVNDPNGIEENNELFSLGLYPNPTEGAVVLNVNSNVSAMATIDVYSITGAVVLSDVKSIRLGANQLNLNLSAVPAGIYLVKADINGHQALTRVEKK